MSRKLVLSYSVIFVILPFLLILLFGGTFISETTIKLSEEQLLGPYSVITALSLIGTIMTIVYFFIFAFKISKTPDVKWVIISAYIGLFVYFTMSLFSFLFIYFSKNSITPSSPKFENELTYLSLIVLPFTLIMPIVGFSQLYLTSSKNKSGSIII